MGRAGPATPVTVSVSVYFLNRQKLESPSIELAQTMTTPSAIDEMDKLQLSDEDTEDLWASPSERQRKPRSLKDSKSSGNVPESSQPRNADTLYDQEEAREAALRNELESVRNINQVIEGVVESLDRAKGNMEVWKPFPRPLHCSPPLVSALLNDSHRQYLEQLTQRLLSSTLGPESFPRRNITRDSFSIHHGKELPRTLRIVRTKPS